MSLQMTDFSEDKVIDVFFRAQAYSAPAAVYLALYTSATTDAGGGTAVSGGGYARKSIALSAASGGASRNTNTIQFTNMPAVTVTHAAIFDALTGGNMLWHGSLTASKTVAAGQTLTIDPNDLEIGFASGSAATEYLQNKIIDRLLRAQTYTAGTIYQALLSSSGEVSGGSYARQAVTFVAPTDGETSNSADVDYLSLPAVTVEKAALYDALTGGNKLCEATLVSPVVLASGDKLTFALGDIQNVVL